MASVKTIAKRCSFPQSSILNPHSFCLVSRYSKGFAWIASLFFIALMMLMVNVALQSSSLERSMSLNHYSHLRSAEAVQDAVKIAYSRFSEGMASCLVVDHMDVFVRPASWWRSSLTCHDQSRQSVFQYIFKPLESDPCQTLDGKNGVQFYAIFVRVEQTPERAMPFLAQAVFAVPQTSEKSCGHAFTELPSVWSSIDLI